MTTTEAVFMYTMGGAIAAALAFFTWLHFYVQHTTRRSLEILAALGCPKCGRSYGRDVAALAREQFIAYCKELHERNPGVGLRIAPYWPVTCASCGFESRFNFERNRLEPDVASMSRRWESQYFERLL